MQENSKERIFRLLAPLFCAAVAGVLLVSAIRSSWDSIFPPERAAASARDVGAWLDAVRAGDEGKALVLAERIAPSDLTSVPDSGYMKIVLDMGMSTLVLTEGYNRFDYLRWKDAAVVSGKIRDEGLAGAGMEKFFNHVCGLVKYRREEPGAPRVQNISDLLARGYGSGHEAARVWCEFARLGGFEAAAVCAVDEKGAFKRLFCEFRKGASVCLADPHSGAVAMDMSAAKAASDPSALLKLCPDDPGLEIAALAYFIPSEFQDYRGANRKLAAAALSAGPVTAQEIFGDGNCDPASRIRGYLSHFDGVPTAPLFTYWRYPFHVLFSRPDFPRKWRLEKAGE